MGCKQSKSYDIDHPESNGSVDALQTNGSLRFSGTYDQGSAYQNTSYDVSQDERAHDAKIQPYDTGLPDRHSLEYEDKDILEFSEKVNSSLKLQIQDDIPELGVISPPEVASRLDQQLDDCSKTSSWDGEASERGVGRHAQFESNLGHDIDIDCSVNSSGGTKSSIIHVDTEEIPIRHTIEQDTTSDGQESEVSYKNDVNAEKREDTNAAVEINHIEQSDEESEIIPETLDTVLPQGITSLPEIVVEMHGDDDEIRDRDDGYHTILQDIDVSPTADVDAQHSQCTEFSDGGSSNGEIPCRNGEVHVTCPSQEGQVTCPSQEGQVTCPSQEEQVTYPSQMGQVTCPSKEGAVTCPSKEGQVTCPSKEVHIGFTTVATELDSEQDSSDLGVETAEGSVVNVFHDIFQYAEESTTVTGSGDEVASYDLESFDQNIVLLDKDTVPPPAGFSDTDAHVVTVS